MNSRSLPVHVVDDDPAVLKALSRLLRASGFEVWSYLSADEFIANSQNALPGCVVLDISLPGLSGLDLQQWLLRTDNAWPIIFISGKSDIPISVRAMKAGAVDFLTKPVDAQALLQAIQLAQERQSQTEARISETNAIRARLATLTSREREVLHHIVSGQLNKQVASDLGTVEKTIKVHRSRIMHKMGASSLAALVRMADRAGIDTLNPTESEHGSEVN